jgi:hypothetical protein
MHRFNSCLLAITLGCFCSAAAAGYREDIGYTQLHSERPGAPNGAGIPVAIVEGTDNSGNYAPDTTHPEFASKTIAMQSGLSGPSGHATTVAIRFFGNSGGIAPGVTDIHAYSAGDWLGNQLNFGSALPPQPSNRRLANHSWIHDFENNVQNGDALRRLDYIIENDDYIQVVGMNNGSTNYPLWANSYNAITVGVTSGSHPRLTTATDSVYVAGRVRPTVVAPQTLTSFATPLVAGTVASLLQYADNNPGISNGSYVSPRTGRTVHHAATSEVIKSVIMTGADRFTSNTAVSSNITDFRSAGNQTANGLDARYGAGQVNIYNALLILEAGEQEAGSVIAQRGFDYSAITSGATANYFFTGQSEANASLVWNAKVNPGVGMTWNPSVSLADFNLYLYQVAVGGDTLIASSTSSIDNTEHIFIAGLDPTSTYRLAVSRSDGLVPAWEYGLSWNLVPEPAALAWLPLAGLLLHRRRGRAQRTV